MSETKQTQWSAIVKLTAELNDLYRLVQQFQQKLESMDFYLGEVYEQLHQPEIKKEEKI